MDWWFVILEFYILFGNHYFQLQLILTLPQQRMQPNIYNMIFTLLLAGVIALSIKMIGTLLITGLLIIPAAASRNITNNPKQMVFVAILIGILSVTIGLFTSLELNTSSGPSIIVIALILFIISLIPLELRGKLQK